MTSQAKLHHDRVIRIQIRSRQSKSLFKNRPKVVNFLMNQPDDIDPIENRAVVFIRIEMFIPANTETYAGD